MVLCFWLSYKTMAFFRSSNKFLSIIHIVIFTINILYQVYQTKRGHERIKIICMVRTYDSLKWLNNFNIDSIILMLVSFSNRCI